MPELPDLEVYLAALRRDVVGCDLLGVRIVAPSLLRTVEPPLPVGQTVATARRIGKRLVLGFDDRQVAIHLMVSGRLSWKDPGVRVPGKVGLAAFDFDGGTLLLTEASSRRRASVHVVNDLAEIDPGGVEPLEVDLHGFAEVLVAENRTLKRALTDPTAFAGIGNAYSDEILHRAGLSPQQRTRNLTPEETHRLYGAMQNVLTEWTARLLHEASGGWPKKVTAFHPAMAVHGKFGEPCPVCGTPVQRVAVEREYQYCPTCQTQGRLLADRATSRFLKGDRPRRVSDLGAAVEEET